MGIYTLTLLYSLTLLRVAYAQEFGQWGALIKLPLVPMAAAVIPKTNQLLLWSAASSNMWTLENPGAKYTMFSTIDLSTMQVSQRTVSNTGHDMFCPGITLDANGQLVVSGGSTATPVSSYNASTSQWVNLAELNIPRGYHSTALTSEGRIFAIGGSWSGGFGGKIGEIYDSKLDMWNTLPGCSADAILTNDREGLYRSDNHANLFTWKDASIFHAGPSKTMHWFDTRGPGRTVSAGLRLDASDAMCNSAVMYDSGKILIAGGSPDYSPSPGLGEAFVVSLADAYQGVTVEKVAPLNHPRALANSVVLPDGQVLVTGGQQRAEIFTDYTAVFTPELYNPVTKTWRRLVNDTTPRTYHSVSILLPDASVFSGGGGACGDCAFNHLDGSIFKPPYLFKNGQLATRPVIKSVSATTVPLGGTVSVTIDGANLRFAFVRMGSATHSVNTDQRRISVVPSSSNGNVYALKVPSDAGVAPVGFWYLFALSADGVPSVATTLRFTSNITPSPLQNNLPDANLPCAGGTEASSFYTAPSGEIFAVCPNTNMNNRKDLTMAGNLNSVQDCSLVCSQTAGCTMVTYLPDSKACYMKYGRLSTSASGPGWPSAIKVRARPCAQNAAVSGITTSAQGRIYGICSGTNFNGQDAYVDTGVQSITACSERCASRKDCVSATWISSSNTCYMKTTLRPALADGSMQSVFRMQLSPCLNRAAPSSTYVTSNGDIYGVCSGQDFYGADLSSRTGVANVQACAQACASTTGCSSATYIQDSKTCYMKKGTPNAVAWTGRDATFRIGIAF